MRKDDVFLRSMTKVFSHPRLDDDWIDVSVQFLKVSTEIASFGEPPGSPRRFLQGSVPTAGGNLNQRAERHDRCRSTFDSSDLASSRAVQRFGLKAGR